MKKMEKRMSNNFLKMLEGAESIAITGHTRPDGDCVGSALGLYNYIKDNYNIEAQVYLEEFSKDFNFICGADMVKHENDNKVYDLCIAVDCGDKERQKDFISIYENARHTMCVDHHVSNAGFGDVCYVDADACSASEALYKLMDTEKISKNAADALYMGIVHDTGVFKHSNTTKSAMCIAGDLISKGANPAYIIDETFYKKNYAQNKLLGIALTKSELHLNAKVISTVLDTEDFERAEASSMDTEGIVDQLRITEGIEVAIFMYRTEPGKFKISLRSNNFVDVSAIAVSHGGGGHVRAAGFAKTAEADDIINMLINEISAQFTDL